MANNHSTFRWLATAAAAALLVGCAGDQEEILPGERISVLQRDAALAADPALAATPVDLPAAVANAAWPQVGGDADNVMGNLAAAPGLNPAWTVGAGRGSSGTLRLLATPIVADGKVFVLDSTARLRSFDASSGREGWSVSVVPPGERSEPLGGGVAFADGRLFVTNGYRQIYAIDPSNGGMIWERTLAGPTRAAPTVADGRVFVLTADNSLNVLSAGDGAPLWDHRGIAEAAGVLGQASPAVQGGVVVVPYSSGEIYALRIENGRPAWQDSLAGVNRMNAVSALADIRGLPVIDSGMVIAASNSGRMIAIDLRSGGRAWEQAAGGISTPWVVGDHVFAISRDNQLVALDRKSGQARWVRELDRFGKPDTREDPILWTGPVMANGRLIVVSSRGDLLSLSPENGSVVAERRLSTGATLSPVIADGTLYVLTDDGTLTAFR